MIQIIENVKFLIYNSIQINFWRFEMNVYDFDKTIYDGDSTADFYFFCLKRHKKALKYLPRLLGGYIKFYIFRKGTKTQFKEKMYSFLNYVVYPDDLSDFWATHKKNIKSWYYSQKRDDDVIISASPIFLLEPMCKELGVYLIASKVNKHNGKTDGENCHSQEKVRRFYEIFPDGKIEDFYSDSYSDTPLAKISQKAFLVKGDQLIDWKFKN